MTVRNKKITFSIFNLEKDTPSLFTKLQMGIIGLCSSLGVVSYMSHKIDLMAMSGLLGSILPVLFNFFAVEEIVTKEKDDKQE